mmetsp:Transcript_15284/g.22756  ORF Transcript_15284/g.22756 Transcript_15284/m.22756 type:complete len:88 (+) Transcript_15284:943-1206(+)
MNKNELTQKGETAPDITFIKSETVKIKEWQRQTPIGKCHHNVLQYWMEFEEVVNPLKERERVNKKKTTISWAKVKWDEFNEEVERLF